MRAFAYRLLGRREYSVHELGQRLRQKWRSVEDIDALADELVEALLEENLVSDERFAESFVRSRMNSATKVSPTRLFPVSSSPTPKSGRTLPCNGCPASTLARSILTPARSTTAASPTAASPTTRPCKPSTAFDFGNRPLRQVSGLRPRRGIAPFRERSSTSCVTRMNTSCVHTCLKGAIPYHGLTQMPAPKDKR